MDIGRQEGARLLCGGGELQLGTPGHYMAPAIFADCDNAMRICREEIRAGRGGHAGTRLRTRAGPANDTEFGLASGICSTSLKHVQHFKRHAQAGMVMVNVPTAGVDYHVPFGGRKGSSLGSREQGSHAIEFYTTVKTAYVAG